MRFSEAAADLSPNERDTISRVLRVWRNHDTRTKQIARNFVHESHFPEDTHKNFLRDAARIWEANADDARTTFAQYANICRAYKLAGLPIIGPSVSVAGHANPYDTFRYHVQQNLAAMGIPVSAAALDIELRALAIAFAADLDLGRTQARRIFRNYIISGMPTWCTFINPNRNTDPYVAPRDTAPAICENYGLGNVSPSQEIVAITYSPPLRLRFPTIADAEHDMHFRSAPELAEHGWTEPLNKYDPFGSPQPEAVHEPLTGSVSNLTFRTVL